MLTFHAVLLDNTDDNHSYPTSEENKPHAAFHGIGPHFRLKSILWHCLSRVVRAWVVSDMTLGGDFIWWCAAIFYMYVSMSWPPFRQRYIHLRNFAVAITWCYYRRKGRLARIFLLLVMWLVIYQEDPERTIYLRSIVELETLGIFPLCGLCNSNQHSTKWNIPCILFPVT